MASIQHIAFSCIDRLAQERFYRDFLGFRRVRVFNPGAPNEFVMLRLGSACIELFGAKGDSLEPSPGAQPVGFKHLAFELDDLEKTVNAIRAAGIKTKEIADCSRITPGMRVCFLNDPEGNIIELMEGWQDEENPPEM